MTMRTDRGVRTWIAQAALAAGALLAAAGCAAPRNYKDPSVFTVRFAGACAEDVEIDPEVKNCPPESGVVPKDCVRVVRGKRVKFVASPLADASGRPNDFVVLFETPFVGAPGTAFESSGGATPDLQTRRNDGDKGGKPHTFVVTTKNPPPSGCKRIDPQIILD